MPCPPQLRAPRQLQLPDDGVRLLRWRPCLHIHPQPVTIFLAQSQPGIQTAKIHQPAMDGGQTDLIVKQSRHRGHRSLGLQVTQHDTRLRGCQRHPPLVLQQQGRWHSLQHCRHAFLF